MPEPTDSPRTASLSPVDYLRRWEEFGAVWRVVERDRDSVTISMCRCDGGEEVERLTTADPALVAWLARRTHSDEAPVT
jgi:hypothetical protein